MEIHYYSAMVVLGLLVFRLIWGIVGSSTARFTNFLVSPGAMLASVRDTKRPASKPGHSPVGGYSVMAMLTALVMQILTGLFATDLDGLESGPLSYWISFEASRAAAEFHEVAFNILLALIILHISSIFFYLAIRKQNLIKPMLTGNATKTNPNWQDMVSGGHKWLIFAIVVAIAVVLWVFGLAGSSIA